MLNDNAIGGNASAITLNEVAIVDDRINRRECNVDVEERRNDGDESCLCRDSFLLVTADSSNSSSSGCHRRIISTATVK